MNAKGRRARRLGVGRQAEFTVSAASLLLLSLCAAANAQSSFSFADIEFWVGSGASRAAMVVDWAEDSAEPPALVWGYRWDGAATGRDMLTAILAADARLFAKLGGPPASPVAVYGLGYDANDDGQFALDDGTMFDEFGVAITGPADGAIAADPNDRYAEGWFIGFWHYGVATTNPYDGGQWVDGLVGMAGRELADGAWDSWTFSPTFDFEAFAENPQAAPSPYPPGDYDQSGTVDAADYQFWKGNFGSASTPAADGNGNGIVDAADYTIWRDHLGGSTSSAAIQSHHAPEPCTAWLVLSALWLQWLLQ